MKTKEELFAIKEEVNLMNKKLAELNDEELEMVTGGLELPNLELPEGFELPNLELPGGLPTAPLIGSEISDNVPSCPAQDSKKSEIMDRYRKQINEAYSIVPKYMEQSDGRRSLSEYRNH